MEIKTFLIAEYAANVPPDNKLVIAGTFNTVQVKRVGVAPSGVRVPVPVPSCYLVAILECSIAEGTVHQGVMRVVDGNGLAVADPARLGELRFIANREGIPMRYQLVLRINGMAVPEPGDFSFELIVDGKRIGDTVLYVRDITDDA